MEEYSQWQKNFKKASVMVANGSVLSGKINIKNYPRLSDLMRNSDEHYITLVGAESGGSEEKTFIINKKYVVWLEAGPSMSEETSEGETIITDV